MPQVFLDIDIDREKEAFELGAAFVDANDIKYSLSSKDVLLLGGSEIARLPELFESDYEWGQKGRAIFKPPTQRVVIELFVGVRSCSAREPIANTSANAVSDECISCSVDGALFPRIMY